MKDLILQHWNDFLTILLAIGTFLIGYYQVQDYRARSSDLKVSKIYDGVYKPQKGSGEYETRGESGGSYSFESTNDDIKNTYYSIEILAEVDGREPTTILNTLLVLPDTNEEIELTYKKGLGGVSVKSPIRLEGNDGKQIHYIGHGGGTRELYK